VARHVWDRVYLAIVGVLLSDEDAELEVVQERRDQETGAVWIGVEVLLEDVDW